MAALLSALRVVCVGVAGRSYRRKESLSEKKPVQERQKRHNKSLSPSGAGRTHGSCGPLRRADGGRYPRPPGPKKTKGTDMPTYPLNVAPKVRSWCPDADAPTLGQVERMSRLPFVADYVAMMPDAHLGKGAAIGTVFPTIGAVVPSAVGVDIGCGMIASMTDLTSSDLPENLSGLMPLIETQIPSRTGSPDSPGVPASIGNPASFTSCSHGSGRLMSRTKARETFTVGSLEEAMGGRVWNAAHAEAILDEHPGSYRDPVEVMGRQSDLVSVEHTLTQIFNYKGWA